MTGIVPSDVSSSQETDGISFFPLLERAKSGGFVYRVYRSSDDYIDVTAHTASDALSRSDIGNAIRIEHLHARMPDILEATELDHRPVSQQKEAE